MKRTNPKVEILKFQAGFWHLPQDPDPYFHVTPNLSDILRSNEISPRYSRATNKQTLGGFHDVSISLYNNIISAKRTLLYLYRIWQHERGFLTNDQLIQDFGVDRSTFLYFGTDRKFTHSNSNELFKNLCKYFNSQDPFVLGLDWIKSVEEKDFALIVLRNTCKYVCISNLWTKGNWVIDVDHFPSFLNMLLTISRSKERSYLWGRQTIMFYDHIRQAIIRNNSTFKTHYDSYLISQINDSISEEFIFGERLDSEQRSIFGATTPSANNFALGNVEIDLNPFAFPIDQICEYCAYEDELRVFKKIPRSDFIEILTVEDIIKEATILNNGIEPLLWRDDFTPTSAYSVSAFKFLSTQPLSTEPYIQKLQTFNSEYNPFDVIHRVFFHVQMALRSYVEKNLEHNPEWLTADPYPLWDERSKYLLRFPSNRNYNINEPKSYPDLSRFILTFEMIDTDDPRLQERNVKEWDYDGKSVRIAEEFHRVTTATPLVFVDTEEVQSLVFGKYLLKKAREIKQQRVPLVTLTFRSTT